MATTYYVNSSTGNDSRTSVQAQNPATPWLTIAKGTANATQPDDIISCLGTFTERVTSMSSGTSGHPITLTGNGSAIWQSTSGVLVEGGALKLTGVSNVTVTGWTFKDIAAQTIVDFTYGASNTTNVTISSNTFTNCGNQGNYPCANPSFPDPVVGRCGSDDNSRIVYFHGPNPIQGNNIIVNGNTFTSNYGAMIWFIRVVGGEIKNNSSTGVKSSRAGSSNGFQFLFRLLCHIGNGSSGVTVDSNTLSSVEADNYALTAGNNCGPTQTTPCRWQGAGIKFDVSGSSNTVTNNTLSNINTLNNASVLQGIFAESDCNSNDIRNNIISNLGVGAAIKIGSVATTIAKNNIVDGNTIFNSGCGIDLINQSGTLVRNNIVHSGSQAGALVVYRTNTGLATFSNNLYYDLSGGNMSWAQSDAGAAVSQCVTPNKTFAQFETAVGEINPPSVTGNPLFVSEVIPDFHLLQGSPAIGTGIGGINMGAYPNQVSTTPIISNVAISDINYNQFTVTWTTDVASNSQINYGLTSAYGSSTTLDATNVISHSVTVTGLTAATKYHFQARSAQGINVTLSGDFNAVTVIPRPTNVTIS